MARKFSLEPYGIRKKRRKFDFPERKSTLRIGSIHGNYRFLNLIGRGGFGEVYEAESIEIQRKVAIKLYKIEDKEALKAFKRGANFLAQIDHPNIIKLFDFFTTGNYALMVMELLNPNQMLRNIVGDFSTQNRISDFLQIFREILSTVRYCHQKRFQDLDGNMKIGIFHGDIKPDNIFLHKNQIKVADFMIPDLEKFLFESRSKSPLVTESFPFEMTRLYGTPMYMSPEQINGVVNEQTDIYNIGVTAFELLTGFYPYDNEEDFDKHLCQSPARYCPFSPDWLNTILMKCVVNDASKRYIHISEIERDLMGELTKEDSSEQKNKITKVLVVFANPKGSDPLRLGAEDKIIHECIRLSRHRDNIHLSILHAATIHDVRRALLEHDYKIVHFSGHGTGNGLGFEDEIGEMHFVSAAALSEFLTAYSPPIECVILNACYTKSQGKLLTLGVPHVIANEGPISDTAAIEFTRGFYDAIGAGKDIEFAYHEGCRTIKLTGQQVLELPVLLHYKILS